MTRKPTSAGMFYIAHRKCADLNNAMLDMLYGPNPITDEELRKLIDKRPHIYGKFSGYIGKRPGMGEKEAAE